LLTCNELKAKLDDNDMSTLNDQLLTGDRRTNDTSFYEQRCYFTDFHLIKFVFLTRCFSGQMRNELRNIAEQRSFTPDVIVLNSGQKNEIDVERSIDEHVYVYSYLGYNKI
jgi:hypothetical protein